MPERWRNPNLDDRQHLTVLGRGPASPGYWARVVAVQRERVRAHQIELEGYVQAGQQRGEPIPQIDGYDARLTIPWRIGADAHYLVYAADHVLTLCRRYQTLSDDDPRIRHALRAFEQAAPDLSELRDYFAHFEDYALGTGWRAKGVMHYGPDIAFDDEDDLTSEITISVGDRGVRVHRLADEVQLLADKLKPLWWELVQPPAGGKQGS